MTGLQLPGEFYRMPSPPVRGHKAVRGKTVRDRIATLIHFVVRSFKGLPDQGHNPRDICYRKMLIHMFLQGWISRNESAWIRVASSSS